MVYNRQTATKNYNEFDEWYEKTVSDHNVALIEEDMLVSLSGSGLHEYNGISTDWRFTYTGRGIF